MKQAGGPRGGREIVRGVALAAAWLGLACGGTADGDPVDDAPRPGLVTVDSATVRRVVGNQSSLLFVDLLLRNSTMHPVVQPVSATFSSGQTSAGFNLQPATTTIVGCVQPNPWALPAGGTKAVRMRLDLRSDPALLLVACAFDAAAVGIDDASARMFTAPRKGDPLPSGFTGALATTLVLRLDAPCTPSSCPDHALVQASAMVTGP